MEFARVDCEPCKGNGFFSRVTVYRDTVTGELTGDSPEVPEGAESMGHYEPNPVGSKLGERFPGLACLKSRSQA
jgi:hypothetical protein